MERPTYYLGEVLITDAELEAAERDAPRFRRAFADALALSQPIDPRMVELLRAFDAPPRVLAPAERAMLDRWTAEVCESAREGA